MYKELFSWNNLLLAYTKAAKGKRGKANVAGFEYRLEENLLQLQAELKDKTYKPRGYVSFQIHEPKVRIISAAPFQDRVAHHALCNLIEPIFERTFIYDSYANRIGKGTHAAVNRCQQFTRQYRYVLACDVRQFFPSLDHSVLRDVLSLRLQDPDVLWLIDRILESGEGVLAEAYDMVWFPGDDLLAVNRPRGLPIGNLTSQFWANCYLNPFDHFVKRELRCEGYIRYVDDVRLFSNDKKQLWAWHEAITARLSRYRLTIHPNAQPCPVTEGVPFLGFVIYPDRKQVKKRKGLHFRRRFERLVTDYADGIISLDQLDASVQGWINHVRYGNTVGLRKAILTSTIIPSPGGRRES